MGTRTDRSLNKSRRTALYRLYDEDGALLYIGIAFNPRIRWYQHATDKSWWPEVARKEVSWHATRYEAEAAEVAGIRSENPRYNIAEVDQPLAVPPKARRARPRPTALMAGELGHAGVTFGRTKQAHEKARHDLGELVKQATADGIGPAEITRLIEHRLTEKTVARIIRDYRASSADS